MVEVDLRLFVTCRLCLDVQGHFHIDPNVQEQIKYCFDIDVEPFDGLPQLICKKCEHILRDHYAIKKNFTDKQKELKTKAQVNARTLVTSPVTQQNESDINLNNGISSKYNSDSSDDKDANDKDDNNANAKNYHEKCRKKKKKIKKKRTVNRIVSSSDDDLESNDTRPTIKAKLPSHGEKIISWETNFNKYFVCRICSHGFQEKQAIIKHIRKHNNIENKFKNVFTMSCLVVMDKCDSKPNVCDNDKTVVYSPDSFIQNTHNPFYYTKYHPKTYSVIANRFKYLSKNIENSESTDEEEVPLKKRRLLSQSSSETVVLNQHSEPEDTSITESSKNPPKIIDCIDLGDSSDNGSYESNQTRNNSNKRKSDSKSMKKIIKMCHNKYSKQTDAREKNKIKESEKIQKDVLQHKVLSIGRKIINNKGFNCTGLLRYVKDKDLCVIWKETSVLKANNDGKYVRIAIRVRGSESSDTNNNGWIKFLLIKYKYNECVKLSSVLKNLKKFENFKKKSDSTRDEGNISCVETLPRNSSGFSHTNLELSKIDLDNTLHQKLLNKNPVLNPKQLPKKVNGNEGNSKTMKVFSAPNMIPINVSKIEKKNETETNLMPIIVSVGPVVDKEKNGPTGDTATISNNQQTKYPRIKVKPVSELMPERPTANIAVTDVQLNGTRNASQVSIIKWPTPKLCSPQVIPAVMSNTETWPSQSNSFMEQGWPKQGTHLSEQHNTIPNNNMSKSSNNLSADMVNKEYLLLHTVEFPNKKTYSPFQYLKDLLLVHNITLIDSNQHLPQGAVSLIKLKLVYHQEKCEPIALCSLLFCYKNIFCIQIMDLNYTNVNVSNLSANWQWQLLKIYSDEVVTKVLRTAAKVSQETYKYTHEFFTLLKSIKSIDY